MPDATQKTLKDWEQRELELLALIGVEITGILEDLIEITNGEPLEKIPVHSTAEQKES